MTGSEDQTTLAEVFEQLDELEDTVQRDDQQRELEDVRDALERLPGRNYVRGTIYRYTTRDVAESFVGSILISLPLLVEDGVFDIADHFLAHTVLGVPIWLVANVTFLAILTWGLLFWTSFRDVQEVKPIFGVIPRRLVGVLLISLITATVMMTMWGRVENWEDPAVAFARISVIWTAAAFGAALGDILPGPSQGTDLGDVPTLLSESLQEGRDPKT